MYKRVLALLLALVLGLGMLPIHTALADEENVLILSDTEGDSHMEAAFDYLYRLMAYTNAQVTYEDAWADIEDVSAYTSVIVLVEPDRKLSDITAWAIRESGVKTFVIGSGGLEQLSRQTMRAEGSVVVRWEDSGEGSGDILVKDNGILLLQGEGESLGGQVFVNSESYPLCKTVGNITHLAYFDGESNVLCAMLASMIQLWQWPYENAPTVYGSYVVLDRVYPFYEPSRLMEITDMLEEEGVPFALALMPIYDHAEYPAMKRFCEYLRYLQSRGVGMILSMPQVTLSQVDSEELIRHMEIAYSAYSAYAVYPTALQAPEVYLLCEKGIDILKSFRTIFTVKTDEPIPGDRLHTNVARKDGHQIIASAWDDDQAFTTSFAQAIYLDVNEDVETLRTYVKRIKASKRVVKSLTQMENTLFLSDNYIVQNEQGLTINGVQADLNFYPFSYDEDYEFDRGFAQYLTDQIETSNKLILIFVFVACTLFITFTLLSRRVMRKDLVQGMSKKRQKVKNTPDREATAQEVDQG